MKPLKIVIITSNIVKIYKATEQGKKIVKCAEEGTAPLSLPDLTQAEKAQLKQASQGFQNSIDAIFSNLSDEEGDFLFQMITEEYGTRTMNQINNLPEEEQEAFFETVVMGYMQEHLLSKISADEWNFFSCALMAVAVDELE